MVIFKFLYLWKFLERQSHILAERALETLFWGCQNTLEISEYLSVAPHSEPGDEWVSRNRTSLLQDTSWCCNQQSANSGSEQQ